ERMLRRLGDLRRDATFGERSGVEGRRHRVARSQNPDSRKSVPGGLPRDFSCNVESRQRQFLSALFESGMGRIVRTHEEIRTSLSESKGAFRQDRPNLRVIPAFPSLHALPESDGVQSHVRVLVWTQLAKALLTERPEAKCRSLGAVSKNAEVSHR